MTNSSPPEPSPRNSGLKRDEVIGVVVAFATIGSILYWGMSPKDGGWTFNLDKSSNLFGFAKGNNQNQSGIFRISGNAGAGNGLTSPQSIIGQQDEEEISSKLSFLPKGSAGADQKLSSAGVLSQEAKNGTSQSLTAFSGLTGLGGISTLGLSRNPATVSRAETTTTEGEDSTSSTTAEADSGATAEGDSGATSEGEDSTSTTAEGEDSTPSTTAETDSGVTSEGEDSTSTTAEADSQGEDAPATVTFSDVPPQHWAQTFITGLAAKKIVSGFPDSNNFQPDEPVTRAQLARYIEGAFDRPKKAEAVQFPDIPENYWATSAIDEAVSTGFMKGYAEGNFQPTQEIPRVQALVALATGLELKPSVPPDQTLERFQDRDQIPDWAKSQVAAATEAGLVVNYPDLQALQPNQPATRAEVAAMIYQALVRLGKVEEAPSDYIVSP